MPQKPTKPIIFLEDQLEKAFNVFAEKFPRIVAIYKDEERDQRYYVLTSCPRPDRRLQQKLRELEIEFKQKFNTDISTIEWAGKGENYGFSEKPIYYRKS